MEFLKIVLAAVGLAIGYGIFHDQITARLCVEYFTVGHPPLFATQSPTLLALGWGTISTWWAGAMVGIPLAVASRAGPWRKLTLRQQMRPALILFSCMGVTAAAFGWVGFLLAQAGKVELPGYLALLVPPGKRSLFIADWWAHSASYGSGFIGGFIICVASWMRRRPHPLVENSS